jgi:beta-lactamase class A
MIPFAELVEEVKAGKIQPDELITITIKGKDIIDYVNSLDIPPQQIEVNRLLDVHCGD